MFSIRKANMDDRFLINDLASQVWENTYGRILTKDQLEYMFEMMYSPENLAKQMAEPELLFFIVYDGDTPSGYLSIEQKDESTYIFQKIYVLPRMQGTGMGRYIIEQGVAYLKNIHPHPFTIILYVNRENSAVGFYKHLGFEVIDVRDHHIGNGYYMNDYIMEWRVGSEGLSKK